MKDKGKVPSVLGFWSTGVPGTGRRLTEIGTDGDADKAF
jgi:hypothetical protein